VPQGIDTSKLPAAHYTAIAIAAGALRIEGPCWIQDEFRGGGRRLCLFVVGVFAGFAVGGVERGGGIPVFSSHDGHGDSSLHRVDEIGPVSLPQNGTIFFLALVRVHLQSSWDIRCGVHQSHGQWRCRMPQVIWMY